MNTWHDDMMMAHAHTMNNGITERWIKGVKDAKALQRDK